MSVLDYTVLHNDGLNRFETVIGPYLCSLVYRIEGGYLDVVHTYVPPELEGQGIASALMQAASDYAKHAGLELGGSCAYARAWLLRHTSTQKGRGG